MTVECVVWQFTESQYIAARACLQVSECVSERVSERGSERVRCGRAGPFFFRGCQRRSTARGLYTVPPEGLVPQDLKDVTKWMDTSGDTSGDIAGWMGTSGIH